jgi:hypothetical protein
MRISLMPTASSNYKKQADYDVITSFLNKEIANVAERKAINSKKKLLKQKQSTNKVKQQIGLPLQKSYILWSAKAGSAEALTAMKQMKGIQIKYQNICKNRPIVAVIYPSESVSNS